MIQQSIFKAGSVKKYFTWICVILKREAEDLAVDGGVAVDCWRRTWFSASKLIVFPSSLLMEGWIRSV
jgi:hypothetical protein